MEDPSWVHQAFAAGGAAITGLVAIIYNSTHKRIDGVEDQTKNKADKDALDKHFTKLDRLVEKIEEHIADETQQFGDIYEKLHSNHLEVIRELNKKADR